MRTRSYSDLRRLQTFEERFDYLQLRSQVGGSTFGSERYLNQGFYTSREWRSVRDIVITRDNGCDLGLPGFEIHDVVIIHHMNPMSVDDIIDSNDDNLDPSFLITTSLSTHNAIHFGDRKSLRQPYKPRERGDTKLW